MDTTFKSKQTIVGSDWLQFVNNTVYRFTQPYAGSLNRTATSKLQDTIDLRDFYNLQDGQDCTAAIVAAAASGKSFYIRGNYTLSQVTLTGLSNIDISGPGTLTLNANPTQTIPGVGTVALLLSGCQGVRVSGITILGNAKVGMGLGLYQCTGCTIEDNEVSSTAGVCGVASYGGTNNFFLRNKVHDHSRGGMFIGSSQLYEVNPTLIANEVYNNHGASGIGVVASGGLVLGNRSYGNSNAGIIPTAQLNSAYTADLRVIGNFCYNNGFHGIQADPQTSTTGGTTVGVIVQGNHCIGNTNSGIFVHDSNAWIIVANHCENNGSTGITIGINCSDCVVSSNVCRDSRSGAARTQQNGIYFDGNGGFQRGHVVQGNSCRNNVSAGLVLAMFSLDFTDFNVGDNVLCANGQYGLRVTDGNQVGASLVFCGNTLRENGTQDIRVDSQDALIVNNLYDTEVNVSVFTLSVNSTTPSVRSRRSYQVANNAATAITNFTGGSPGQQVILYFVNALTTLTNGATLVLKGLTNVTPAANSIMVIQNYAGVWREVSRNF